MCPFFRSFHSLIPLSFSKEEKKKPKELEQHAFHDQVRQLLLLSVFLVLMHYLKEDGDLITWNEFANEMLAKGEVQRVQVNPEAGIVEVFLYPGAIMHKQRVSDLMLLK